jgi:hypothetical protein
MMFVGLPDGFTMEKEKSGVLIGETWAVAVYYKKRLAFQMVSDFDVSDGRPRYSARSVTYSSDWQEFSSLGEMVLVMCTKHRMGVE